MNQSKSNHLAGSTSPYLLQHAENPVHWWPWCSEALQQAREQNKPILLSIGYSACHWCHVMAHESFEDKSTAELMNELFINIKVDREERPDLDKIYQTSHQLLSQRPGGWPLTVFLTPQDQIPFFAGTYFPREPRHGLPAFKQLMQQIHQAYIEQGDAIAEQGKALQKAMAQLTPKPDINNIQLTSQPLGLARQQLAEDFDQNLGGFGAAPKFPHPSSLQLLLQYSVLENDAQAADMACFSLQKMALGGVNDLLGGGFYRYSVDDQWMIPHFEKMLYDNGPLLTLYADAWRLTGDDLFLDTCEQTAAWVMREMQSPLAGYYSSLDADSEGVEGKFYMWDRQQVRDLLSTDEYSLLSVYYGLDKSANFVGRWHLHRSQGLSSLAQQMGIPLASAQNIIDNARNKLLEARNKRIRPGRDDKTLTSWNALMIKGMAHAGRLLQQYDWIDSAQQAIDFIQQNLWRENRLLASYKDGVSHLPAYLDDYAFLLDALLEMLQARWRSSDLRFAIELADALLSHFQDKQHGGFFFTADDHEQLVHRPKPLSDEATPAGNGVASRALLQLSHLIGEQRYTEAAASTLKMAWPALNRFAAGHPMLLMGLQEYLQPGETLIVRGRPEDMEAWRKQATAGYKPNQTAYFIPEDVANLPGLLADKNPTEGTVAYRCRGPECEPPIHNLDDL